MNNKERAMYTYNQIIKKKSEEALKKKREIERYLVSRNGSFKRIFKNTQKYTEKHHPEMQ